MRPLRFILPGLGLLLLGYLVGKLGIEQILSNFGLMKWSFPAVLALSAMWHITNSIAWSFAFRPDAFKPRLLSLFMAKLAGEAVNQLTPLANVGGEPLKAFLLRSQSPTSRGLASVVVNKTAQIITGLIFTAVGLSVVFLYWELPQSLPLSVKVSLSTLLSIVVLLIGLLYWKQNSMFSSLLVLLKRLGVKTDFIESRMPEAVRIDANIGLFYGEFKWRFFLVLLFHALGWMLGACETYVILRTLGAEIHFEIAFLITSLTVIINSLFFFMPSNIGVLEGGQVFLFLTLGLNPAMGLSLGIIKRMRKILWIFVGWLFLTKLSKELMEENSVREEYPPAAQPDPSLGNRLKYR